MLLLMCLSDSRCALHLLSSGRKNRDAAHTNPHHKTQGRKRKQLHCFFPLILKLGFNIQVKSKTTQPQLFLCSVRCHEVTLCDRSYNVKRSHNLSNFRFQIISERPVVLTSEACCEGCKWNCTDHNKYNWLLKKKHIYISVTWSEQLLSVRCRPGMMCGCQVKIAPRNTSHFWFASWWSRA